MVVALKVVAVVVTEMVMVVVSWVTEGQEGWAEPSLTHLVKISL